MPPPPPDNSQSSQIPYQPESLILPDGPVNGEAAELLEDFVHSQPEELDFDADYRARKAHHKNLPWYKAPTPWWLLAIIPFTAIAMSATIAPRIEVYTLLACSMHKPEILRHMIPKHGHLFDTPRALSDAPENKPITLRIKPSDGVSALSSSIIGRKGGSDKQPTTCASDPTVQAAVAKLSAIITTSMGILSCLTTGWWGSYSDRRGRTRLLSISVLGVLYTDLNFIFVSRNFQHLPGGYWCLILGPLFDGLLGGISTSVATMHAYIADTTTEGSRSRNLSLGLGLLFTGMAIGPAFGSFLISATGNLLSVFYAAAAVHAIYALFVWFILPESLLKSQMQRSKTKHDEEHRSTKPTAGVFAAMQKLFVFLRPLNVFLPSSSTRNPLRRQKDWNLAILAIVYALAVSPMGSYTYKFQYAAATFGWNSETLGYFITLVGATRAIFLAIILPCIIKVFKPTPKIPSTHSNDSQHLLGGASSKAKMEPHSSSFDLGIARISLFTDTIAYIFLAIAPTALVFTLSSLVMSVGAGLSPAVQSVALALYRRRGGTESGRLFGALGVVQALSSQIFGPAVYGVLYANTVGRFPKAIFILSMTTATMAFTLLTFLRLPKEDVRLRGPSEDIGRSLEDGGAEAQIHTT